MMVWTIWDILDLTFVGLMGIALGLIWLVFVRADKKAP